MSKYSCVYEINFCCAYIYMYCIYMITKFDECTDTYLNVLKKFFIRRLKFFGKVYFNWCVITEEELLKNELSINWFRRIYLCFYQIFKCKELNCLIDIRINNLAGNLFVYIENKEIWQLVDTLKSFKNHLVMKSLEK